ncbi:unnamed protein product [Rhodiola kirilowii]
MGMKRKGIFLVNAPQLLLLFLLLPCSAEVVSAGVLDVRSKFAGRDRSISDLKAHDSRRQVSLLTGVDLPLGGSGRADGVGMVSRSEESIFAHIGEAHL